MNTKNKVSQILSAASKGHTKQLNNLVDEIEAKAAVQKKKQNKKMAMNALDNL